MRFESKSTIAYMFRNFWQLVWIPLPVSALIAIFCNPSSEISLFVALFNGEITWDNYREMLTQSLTVLKFGNNWWIALCAIALLALTMSLMVVKLDRHMRMGKMPVFPLRRAFGIFPHMLLYIVCCLAANELGMLIVVGIAHLIGFVGSATAIVSIAIAFAFVVRAFLTYMFGLLIISFPLKYTENYRFNIALSYSARAMSSKRMQLVGLSCLYVASRALVMALAYLLQSLVLDALLYTVAITFCLTFLPCLAFKKFYDDVGGERRDLREILFD